MRWRVSSYSVGNGACAEIAAWRTSSRSGTGNCAEVGQDGAVVGVRDTKDRTGPVLRITPAAWARFIQDLKGTGG